MSLLMQYGIIVSVWILSLLLILIIPRQKRRLAMVAFLFKQYITCIFGHAVVELQLLAYPVRKLSDVSRTFGTMTRVETAKQKNEASTNVPRCGAMPPRKQKKKGLSQKDRPVPELY